MKKRFYDLRFGRLIRLRMLTWQSRIRHRINKKIVWMLNLRKPFCTKCYSTRFYWCKCKPWYVPSNGRVSRNHCYQKGFSEIH